MSNPGVVTLAQAYIGNQYLKIEDNIGEAIHIHYGNLRLDLTISEFFEIVKQIIACSEKMIDVEGFRYDMFDAIFMSECESVLLNLEKLDFVKKNTAQLLTCKFDDFGDMQLIKIKESRVYRALDGKNDELENYIQNNYILDDNLSRLKKIYASVADKGYDHSKSYICIVNDSNFVYDGLHRVSSIIKLYGDIDIEVANFITGKAYSNEYEKKKKNDREMKKKRLKDFNKNALLYLINRDLKNKKIIIKGGGKHTVELLKIYNGEFEICGIWANEVIYNEIMRYRRIDSQQVSNLHADYILLSSFRYREDMRQECLSINASTHIYDLYENGMTSEFY